MDFWGSVTRKLVRVWYHCEWFLKLYNLSYSDLSFIRWVQKPQNPRNSAYVYRCKSDCNTILKVLKISRVSATREGLWSRCKSLTVNLSSLTIWIFSRTTKSFPWQWSSPSEPKSPKYSFIASNSRVKFSIFSFVSRIWSWTFQSFNLRSVWTWKHKLETIFPS